jgi:hypothetical protein
MNKESIDITTPRSARINSGHIFRISNFGKEHHELAIDSSVLKFINKLLNGPSL